MSQVTVQIGKYGAPHKVELVDVTAEGVRIGWYVEGNPARGTDSTHFYPHDVIRIIEE